MELKLTADKKLLEAIERLIEAINANRVVAAAPVAAPAEEPKKEPAPQEEPAQAEPEPVEEPKATYTKDAVQHMAIEKIQAGKRDAVKALVSKYGAERVGDVAEDKLAAFAAELEAL